MDLKQFATALGISFVAATTAAHAGPKKAPPVAAPTACEASTLTNVISAQNIMDGVMKRLETTPDGKVTPESLARISAFVKLVVDKNNLDSLDPGALMALSKAMGLAITVGAVNDWIKGGFIKASDVEALKKDRASTGEYLMDDTLSVCQGEHPRSVEEMKRDIKRYVAGLETISKEEAEAAKPLERLP